MIKFLLLKALFNTLLKYRQTSQIRGNTKRTEVAGCSDVFKGNNGLAKYKCRRSHMMCACIHSTEKSHSGLRRWHYYSELILGLSHFGLGKPLKGVPEETVGKACISAEQLCDQYHSSSLTAETKIHVACWVESQFQPHNIWTLSLYLPPLTVRQRQTQLRDWNKPGFSLQLLSRQKSEQPHMVYGISKC